MHLTGTSRNIVLKKCYQVHVGESQGDARFRAREPDWVSVESQCGDTANTGPRAPQAGEIQLTTSSFHKYMGLVTIPGPPWLQQLLRRSEGKEGECGQQDKSLLCV